MKHHRHYKEEAENDDLQEKRSKDEDLARMLQVDGFPGLQAGACPLDLKGQDIAQYENLGQVVDADDRMMVCVQQSHHPAEGHVDCCCEEGGSDEGED